MNYQSHRSKFIDKYSGHARNYLLRRAAKILVRSGTFRHHMGSFDKNLDPDFLRAVTLMRNASEKEALFVRDLVNSERTYSQVHQDIWVAHETDHKRNGFFVEFGATDGISLSNTYLLETDLQWRGILAEPNPIWHSDLCHNRQAAIDLRCVYSKSGATVQFAATKFPELGTIIDFVSSDGHARSRQDRKVIEVKTVSLNDLLEEKGAPPRIDYISIDTEGSELEILGAFDFTRWDVCLFSIEHNGAGRRLDEFMLAHGYERRYASYSRMDGWYRKKIK